MTKEPKRPNLPIARTITELRQRISAWRAEGATIGLVPTMGALHDGHLSLVQLARATAQHVVVSIFVNPTQFAPGEDLARYPRDEAGDFAKLKHAHVDLVWAPTHDIMYPAGFATRVVPEGAAEPLEGEFRPGHFAGVATVCTKLFAQVAPDVAVFGEKDYQQLCVIRQLVRDLDLPVAILAAPTSREDDGLARSSRNAYLTPDERRIAPALHRAISGVAAVAAAGGPVNKAIDVASRDLLAAGFTKIDYIAVRDAQTLGPFEPEQGRDGRVLAAAWLGTTRLIDNVGVGARTTH